MSEPAYELSRHASDAIAKRGIELAWLEQALSEPLRVEPDRHDTALEHRLGRIPEFGDRVLRVVVNVEVEPVRIVTLYFDTRQTRNL